MRPLAALAALILTVHGQAQVRPQRFSLPNGLQVVLLEDHERPLVRVRLHLPLNLDPETPMRPGLASLALRVLEGADAGGFKAGDFDQILAGAGIDLAPALRADGLSWELVARSRDQDLALGRLADRVLRPVFDPATLEAQRLACWREVERLEAAPRRKLRLILEPDLTQRPPSLEDLTAITYEDLLAFYAGVLRPDHAVLILHGDLGLEQAKRLVYLSFGTWPARPAPPRVPPPRPVQTLAAPPATTPKAPPVRIPTAGAVLRALAVALEPEDLGAEAEALLALLLPGDPALFPAQLRLEGPDLVAALEGESAGSPSALESSLLERLQALRQRGFTETDLQRARAAWSAGQALAGLHPQALVDEALTEARGRMATPARMDAVTVEALNGALTRWLDPACLRVGVLGSSAKP